MNSGVAIAQHHYTDAKAKAQASNSDDKMNAHLIG